MVRAVGIRARRQRLAEQTDYSALCRIERHRRSFCTQNSFAEIMEDKVNTGNSAVETAEGNPAPAKKTNKSKAKSQEKKASRPATSEMVTAAIKELKDHKGSSLQAIKKYIVATYKVDGEKVAPFIRRYLKAAVSSGAVVQTKGKGASGSFKLSTDNSKPKTNKAQAKRPIKPASKKDKIEKITTARKPAAAKKTATPKKAAESPKKQPAQKKAAAKSVARKKSGKAAIETKAPSKAKKAVKAPAAKTKTPKPKKAAAKAVAISAKK
ncbi:histone H1-like [Polyergus mexicanus]|uniref:histone H1-like n=1 Tax=Polyergus mexicanus TaxID=615972 RepID=UPI0038B47BE3